MTAVASTGVDASLARRRAARERPDWSLQGTTEALRRFSAVLDGHTRDGFGGLAELAAAAEALRSLQAAVDRMAQTLLDREAASFREIGAALEISRQAAGRRYRSSRRPGGQPTELR